MLRNWRYSRSILMAIVLLLAGGLGSFAQSQPPPPGPTKTGQAPYSQPDSSKQTSVSEWWTVASTIAVAAFTGILAISTILLWYATKETAGVAKTSADAALKTAEASIAAERAYVTMSHKTPPALGINTVTPEGKCQARINLEIKNFGRTPARVINLLLTTKCVPSGQSLTEPPDYGDAKPVRINAFLVTRGNVIHMQPNFEFEADMNLVDVGKMDLWVYGYVDYVDAFGQRHRGGYARVYLPGKSPNENNLGFGTESRHNYDRPRVPGEGDDWEDT